MKIARYSGPRGTRIGVLVGEDERAVLDLLHQAEIWNQTWVMPLLGDLRALLAAGSAGADAIRHLLSYGTDEAIPLDRVRLLAPFEAGSRILAHVVNYTEHGDEANLRGPEMPFFFYKSVNTVNHPNAPIIAHPHSSKMDHEVELAAIIGRVGKDIAHDEAETYIAGYTVLNDVSYRDYQMIENVPSVAERYGKNWTQGKNLDLACPIGPYIVLKDEIVDPYQLELTCRVNGELRQKASTSEMIYRVPEMIAEVSKGMTLYPGDIIATGTCAGGGLGTGKYLQPGDVVVCEIESIGTLTNTVMAG
ncbi:fumarylacetoacetate hydrolase family protein [Corticibacterium sp. UT-5YL-CI-8]|nr:fumarylacetoacetate hydrolase family protein [Tianweitania sp. UT-5YL-CI-8]